ncbi:uncharacterized protein LOC118459369 [Anopheles albimanus]|uniref:uncharacterized protein LOC118459369 n=1 Tax=Anopheles albimanus TaxID=7167 RepID=UPI0016409575|nr:uncharacterized protein LOC118459369 [Anopheles albimanus]
MIPLTELLIKEDITQIPALSVLIRFIIVKYYARYYSFCSIGQDFLTDVTIARITLDATASDMSNRNLQLAIDIGCQAFVVEEPGILWFLDHYIPAHHNSQQRSKDKSVMLLIKKRNSDTLLKLISQHVSLRGTPIVYLVFLEYIRCITILINSNLILDIFNVLIIVYNPENLRPDRLYTTVISFTGVQQHNLDHRTSLRIIEVDWINWKLTQFFPDKLTDLQGFVLRLGTFNYLPFSYYERMVEDEDELGVVYANGSGKGILGDVAEGRTDLALGAVYYWFGPYNFTDYTMSISRSGVTMLVPRPHMLPFWYTPFLSFSPVLWAAVFCTLLTGIGAAWYIGYFRYRLLTSFNMERQNVTERLSLSEAILMVVGFFVAQSASIRNDLWSCVVLFASLLLAGFMVSNCYSAGLASVMTIPQYEHSIDTVIDFANSGMQWISPTAIVLEGISGGTEKLLDDLYYQNCAAISIKTNPLLANLNDYILRVQQSGILYYWANIVAMRYQPTGVFRNIENARHHNQLGDGAVRLQIDHFIGAFFILGYGLLCAGFIFLLEVSGTKMVGRLKRRVRSIRC